MLLDGTVLQQVSFNPLEEFHPQLLVGHLTAAESQGYLGPVPITQETYQVAQFYLVIPFLRPWTKLDFFYLNLLLVLLRRSNLLLLLEDRFAIVHHATDRWYCVGRNLYQIELGFFSNTKRFINRDDANLLAVSAN